MSKYHSNLIKEALLRATHASSEFDLNQIVSVIKNFGLEDILNSEESIDLIYERLDNSLPFFHQYRFGPDLIISEDAVERTAAVIRAITSAFTKLSKNNGDVVCKDELFLLVSIFLVIHYIKSDFSLWKNLNFDKPVPARVLNLLHSVISGSDLLQIKLENSRIFEREIFEAYKEGLKEQNFVEIYKFVEIVLRSPVLDTIFFIEESVSFLFWADQDRLGKIFDEQNDLIQIYYLFRSLTISEKLIICLKTNNSFVIFEGIREVVSDRNVRLLLTQVNDISHCIVRVAEKSEALWASFLVYFNSYPTRFSQLQQPLGQALVSLNEAQLKQYVDSLEITEYGGVSADLNNCVNVFLEKAPQDKQNFLLHLFFEKWNTFMNIGLEAGFKVFNVFLTEVFNVVICYISYSLSKEVMVEEIEKLTNELSNVNSIWFNSKALQISYFHILLSKLFIFSFAWKECGYSLENQTYLYSALKQFLSNEYLFYTQNLTNQTMDCINSIKVNFSIQN